MIGTPNYDKYHEWPNNSWVIPDVFKYDEVCLLEEAQKREMEKPPHLRSNVFHISCPCRRCNPFHL